MSCNEHHYLEIYRRILKYPPFSLRRKPGMMKIIHSVDNGTVEITAAEPVTVEDAEKIFAAMYFSKNIKNAKLNNIEVTSSQCHISEIRKLVNCNNDRYIEECLRRVRSLTIKYTFKNGVIVTGILHEVKLDAETGVLTILWNKEFFDACRVKSLTLDLSVYSVLGPVAKNLYGFLISNSGKEFSEDILIERAVIEARRKDNARKILNGALEELVGKGCIQGYTRRKTDGKWTYTIIRNYPRWQENIIHTGRKIDLQKSPQTVDR